MLKLVDTAIHGHAPAAGRPTSGSAARAISAEANICALIACVGCASALTAAFHDACSSALSSAAATRMPSKR
jgi:hypothetical protein